MNWSRNSKIRQTKNLIYSERSGMAIREEFMNFLPRTITLKILSLSLRNWRRKMKVYSSKSRTTGSTLNVKKRKSSAT
jgi:hypothetical protein